MLSGLLTNTPFHNNRIVHGLVEFHALLVLLAHPTHQRFSSHPLRRLATVHDHVKRCDARKPILQKVVGVALRQDHQQSVQTLQQWRQRRRARVDQLQPHVHEHGRLEQLHELLRLQQHRQGGLLRRQPLRDGVGHRVVLRQPAEGDGGEGIQRPRGEQTVEERLAALLSRGEAGAQLGAELGGLVGGEENDVEDLDEERCESDILLLLRVRGPNDVIR